MKVRNYLYMRGIAKRPVSVLLWIFIVVIVGSLCAWNADPMFENQIKNYVVEPSVVIVAAMPEIIWHESVIDKVIRIAHDVEVDPAIALAILKEENPYLNAKAVHVNRNESRDLGLFQLNDRFIESDFVPRYWKSEKPFDPFEAESNAIVALSHLKFLIDYFDDDVIKAVCAYNAGLTAVKEGRLPQSTVQYGNRISKALNLSKAIAE